MSAGETEKPDQDLKKKILKLEFCLQETRSQTRKLNRKGVRHIEINEIRDLKFWDNSGFKIVVSTSLQDSKR
ncbi:hypothetical protein HID58_003742 [Brassica napus]|uniref:Uncharacterized protein n=1 Tax=Brassica napus TaxID=3708 RepID=A0ABQ8EQX7_BRANA|nr:hypothetical protein HID58_003742 [Brassica napus]